MTCPTCKGTRRVHFVAGTVSPAGEGDCPSCVGLTIYGLPGANGPTVKVTEPEALASLSRSSQGGGGAAEGMCPEFAEELVRALRMMADDADLKRRHTHMNGEIKRFSTIVKVAANIIARFALPHPPGQGEGACSTCGGRGEIGGWAGGVASADGGGGYETEPCPDCSPTAEARHD